MGFLRAKELSFAYPNSGNVIESVSFDVEQGDFVLLFGPTGSGKTTLLRLLKPELTPKGRLSGSVEFCGKPIETLDVGESARIAFVQQSAEHQTVTDKVRHELAFGMENLRFEPGLMKRRLAETADYFSLSDMVDKNTAELSGGQKQTLALAAVMPVDPKLIILDEPTSQLDPVAAAEFITKLKKLNEDLGVTVIITEHRLENVLPVCTKLAVMDGGRLVAFGETRQTVKKIAEKEEYLRFLPGAARLFASFGFRKELPLSVREGRERLRDQIESGGLRLEKADLAAEAKGVGRTPALKMKNLYFRYDKAEKCVLNGLSLTVNEGELLCVLGANGSGKSTLLKAAAGLIKPQLGKIEVFGKNIGKYTGQSLYDNCLAMLPQNAETVFVKNTLEDELKEVGADFGLLPYDLSYAAKTHPYDLSGGEQQLAALLKLLACGPRLLLLDEPTKGLDPAARDTVIRTLKALNEKGVTVIAVTHDVEFAALCADRAALIFEGAITCVEEPGSFFSGNVFYTTAVNRVTSPFVDGIVTVGDARSFREAADESD